MKRIALVGLLMITGIGRAQNTLTVPPSFVKPLQAAQIYLMSAQRRSAKAQADAELHLAKERMKLDAAQYRVNKLLDAARANLNLGSAYGFNMNSMSFTPPKQTQSSGSAPAQGPTTAAEAAAAARAAQEHKVPDIPTPRLSAPPIQ